MLDVQSISKQFGMKQVLDNISFSIQQKEVIGLVGENGAGKSTLLNILATIQAPNQGKIILNNHIYKYPFKTIRPYIGFVPQEVAIWEEFTVKENMLFFEKLSWKKRNKKELQQLCFDMHLDKWKEPVHTLSGGMKRKLNLAISLIHDPALLLLDEPTSGIDLKSRLEIGNYLKQLSKQKNKMIMYTSHDMDEILNICDRVLCIGEDPFYYNFLKNKKESVVAL